MSSQLLWQVMRKNHSFLVRRRGAGGVEFSTEKGNLANKNSYKFSGLVNDKALDLCPGVDGGVSLSTRSVKKEKIGKPNKAWNSDKLSGSYGKSHKAIEKKVSGYRPDLKKHALARLSAISRAEKKAATAE
eukprot:Plantae.Rhodophyta-Purpureofilum_apyrenoidigerum.ctg15038.p1 GENE.Plantae.Rhodophyta-Purpureofilum_apyrenoidigerum.ctg15038~~Plantae.Rhodophyta-Purpureofilum_apyrenoidigerum.ctg15038.p1  ORF type:complete len:131 (-),score=33.77 Plantae.Rhodophyta-Purpureofilum_apyrenoidigerum.ctg15038:509-901(-)